MQGSQSQNCVTIIFVLVFLSKFFFRIMRTENGTTLLFNPCTVQDTHFSTFFFLSILGLLEIPSFSIDKGMISKLDNPCQM